MIYNALSEENAADVAARIHQYLVATDSVYAENVAAGRTTSWDAPREVDGAWSIQVQERCLAVMTAEEQTRVS